MSTSELSTARQHLDVLVGWAGMHGLMIPLYVCLAILMYPLVITAAAHSSTTSIVSENGYTSEDLHHRNALHLGQDYLAFVKY